MLHRRRLITAASMAVLYPQAVQAAITPALRRRSDDELVETIALRPSLHDYARIGASVLINGRGPFIFAVDSGSQRSMVADSLAAELGLRTTGATQINGITAPASLPTVAVDELTFGRRPHTGLRLPVARKDILAADGLIGLDILAGFTLTFHIEQGLAEVSGQKLEFGDFGPTEATGTLIPPRWFSAGRTRAGQIITRMVRVGGVRSWAFVDSGAQHSVGNLVLMDALSGRRPRIGPSTPVDIYDIPGLTKPGRRAVVDQLELPGYEIGQTPLVFADLHIFDVLQLADKPAFLIGADLMGRFKRVVLDYPRARFGFELLRPEETASV